MTEKIYVDVDKIRELYKKGTNICDIAMELECNPLLVASRIKQYNIKKINKFDFIDKNFLEDYYINQHLSVREIAKLTGSSISNVQHKIKKFGFSLRPVGGKQELDEERIVYLYCEEGKNCNEIATLVGSSPSTIRRRLRDNGVKLNGSEKREGKLSGALKDVSSETLRRLYIDEKKPAEEIASIFKTTPNVIRQKLSALKILKTELLENKISKEELYDLYINKDMTQAQIAEKYKCSASSIMKKLREYGIVKDTKWNFITKELLRKLYLEQNLYTAEIAEKLQCPFHVAEYRLNMFRLPDLKTEEQKKECQNRASARALAANGNRSSFEDELVEIYPTPYLNKFTIIGKELDLYYPDKRVAIEFNGDYWHSEAHGECVAKKHILKTNLCEQKSIHLFNIFERFWKDSSKKSTIVNLLDNAIKPESLLRIDGEVKEVSKAEAELFVKTNNINYSGLGTTRIGTYSSTGLLLNLFTFSQNKAEKVTIKNFTTRIGYREDYYLLVEYMLDELELRHIEVQCDRRYYNGETFKKEGFVFKKNTTADHEYVKADKAISRTTYKKNPDKYPCYHRVYDCGKSVWELKV